MDNLDDKAASKKKATDNFFKAVNLESLPTEFKEAFLKQVRETLQMRVGQRIAQDLNEQELKEFYGYISESKSEKALNYLHDKVPNHKEILKDEMIKLQAEIKADSDKILKGYSD